jgi:hypothetical protein
VRTPQGAALRGALVAVRNSELGAHTHSDAEGRFQLRLICYAGCPRDTATFWILASANEIVDSVSTKLAFARVGEVPPSATVRITLRTQ